MDVGVGGQSPVEHCGPKVSCEPFRGPREAQGGLDMSGLPRHVQVYLDISRGYPDMSGGYLAMSRVYPDMSGVYPDMLDVCDIVGCL